MSENVDRHLLEGWRRAQSGCGQQAVMLRALLKTACSLENRRKQASGAVERVGIVQGRDRMCGLWKWSVHSSKFGRLALGCINADFRDQKLVGSRWKTFDETYKFRILLMSRIVTAIFIFCAFVIYQLFW